LFEAKRILVTGACGTVGSELVHQLIHNQKYQPTEVIGLDNNESLLFAQEQKYLPVANAHFYVADIKERNDLRRHMKGVDIVFHTAALKHVILCERSPEQTVQTNILGLQNIINVAIECDVERVIFTSSDKAVNPTNVMGTSKLMGERLMTAANSHKKGDGPIFSSTRFGNVLGSNGSVIPIFHNQIVHGGPVTLTDQEMSRFVMTIEDAVKLVIDSADRARGGEVFVTKMPVMRIVDIAQAMIEELAPQYGINTADIKIKVIGTKPGEKLYEELMSSEEIRRAVELENYYSILPAFRGIYNEIDYDYLDIISERVSEPYNSAEQTALSLVEIKAFLRDKGLLEAPKELITQRYWPGDKEVQ